MSAMARDLIAAVHAVGGDVLVVGNRLRVEAPSPLPPELIDELRAAKEEVLAALSGHLVRSAKADASDALHEVAGVFEERAAIVEHEAGVPREWAEGFARLDCTRPPGDVPPARWRRFIDHCGLFLDSGWAGKAAALGWGPLDLFGCNAVKPWARIDQAGLLWLLNGSRLVALATDRAIVELRGGTRQTYCRRDQFGADRALAWELIISPLESRT